MYNCKTSWEAQGKKRHKGANLSFFLANFVPLGKDQEE
jgi:hypothetical protein